MSLINLIPSQNSTLRSPFMRWDFNPAGNTLESVRTMESSITFSNGSVPAFSITAQRSFAPGRRGNNLNFGCVRVDGSRYVLFLFEDDNDKLDGTLSTAGQAAGATTAAGIVNKVNTSAMFDYVFATLHTDATNIDYTGHSAVNLANTDPLIGGRG